MEPRAYDRSPGGDQERWARIKSLFLSALEQPEPDRLSFVAAWCGADAELRDEVLSLLRSDAAAGSFGEMPAAALLREGGETAPGSDPRLAPGTRLGSYELVSFLSAGGMGQVYRARHQVLERPVAIKTVCPAQSDPSARRRLLREARHASSLKHPNICTIHEVGEVDGMPFIVMELVEGRPLSDVIREGDLALGTALEYGVEVADALEHAHEHGIVHRDLKSANVVVNREGRPVVLDFGLARRLPGHPGLERGESMVTGAGALAGTLSHMAPEVLLGKPADRRSDVWALGVLLFEMTAGQLPFKGRTPFGTSSAILDEPPRWPARRVPLAVRLVIERCLVKDPGRRFQRASDVRAALDTVRRRWAWALAVRLLVAARPQSLYTAAAALALATALGTAGLLTLKSIPPAGAIDMVAFLPLENATDDPEVDYYAAGLTDGLMAEVGAALDVRVVGPTSAARLIGGGAEPAAAARELGTDAIITGRLRRASNHIALDVRLIDAKGGRVLWSDTYERSAAQVLALQADVVRGLAAAVRLAVRPGAADRLSAVRAVNPDAYQEYLKGRYEWNQRTPESLDRALAHFVRARDLDPTYAPAHAALADVYSQHATVLLGTGSPLEYRPLAADAAIRALRIDPFSAEAHAALGYVRHYDLRWDEAEQSFMRAMELNPNYPLAHLWYANLLMSRGLMEDALDHAHMARELDPYSLIVNANIGWILAAAGRSEEALAHLDRTLELDSTYVQARFRRMAVLHGLGRPREALEEGERLVLLSNRAPHMVAMVAGMHAADGRADTARALLTELLERAERSYVPPASISHVYEALGEVDAAVDWMSRAVHERSNAISYLTPDENRSGVAGDPRIRELLASARNAGRPRSSTAF
jgi:TolB-like protein/predicted Ser/Thr protein kinase/Flp pilus assembly protein TadD